MCSCWIRSIIIIIISAGAEDWLNSKMNLMAAEGGEKVEEVEGGEVEKQEEGVSGSSKMCWICQEAASLQCPQSGAM